MKEYETWRAENPDWDKDWMEGVGGVTYGKPKQSDGFKEVMSNELSSGILNMYLTMFLYGI